MRTTSSSPGAYGSGPAPATRAAVCACTREVTPAGGSQSLSRATCAHCMALRPVAIPRARLLIRAGAVEVDPSKVRAFGRGPSKQAKRRLRARTRRWEAFNDKTAARSFARIADVARSTAVEASRRAAAKEAA